MKYQTVKIKDLCTIKTGMPANRARLAAEGVEPRMMPLLQPRAMRRGGFVDAELSNEAVYQVKGEYIAQVDDVLIKLSTPYDCVRVDADHAGILVTSFAMILRKKDDAPINMEYLEMVLNAPQLNALLSSISTGQTSTMSMLKREGVANIEVPLPPIERQEMLAALSGRTRRRREECERLIALDQELLNGQLTKEIWGD